jgi:recombinase-like zinc beta ribbon protein/resolvase-like protein/recombinase
MTETNGREISVALYDRLSTKRQGEVGYAEEGHLHELRERLAKMTPPRRIVEEVPDDPGEKRWMQDRPGVRRLKELARAGEIEEIWAWSWERYGQSPVPEILSLEFNERGVTMRSLDDGGEGFGGEILRAVRSVLSGQDMRDRVRKSAMGKRAKARKGHVLGAGAKARYGFRWVHDGKGKVVGYEPHEPEMRTVRRIVGWLAEGRSLYFVQTILEAEQVPAPRGGDRWSRAAAKRIVNEDCYLPHSHEELAGLVAERLMSEEVFAGLDPAAGPFGIVWYGRTRSYYVSTRSKQRRVEQVPRSEWVAIPVPLRGLGPGRAELERARASVADNRATARVGARDCWELSRGFLRCGACGRSMSAYRRRKAGGRILYYYRCQPPSAAHACANRESHRAEHLEYDAVRLFEQYADRGVLLELYDEAVRKQEEETGASGALKRRAALLENRSELEAERRGYLRQNARGVLPDADLDAMLAEVDEQREAIDAELAALEERAAAAQRLWAARGSLAASYNPVHAEWYEDPDAIQPGEWLTLGAGPEEIRRAYRRYGARFEVDGEGTLTLRLSLGLDGGALHPELSQPWMRHPPPSGIRPTFFTSRCAM